MSKAFLEALHDIIDERLVTHALLEEDNPAPAAKKKGAATAGKKKSAAVDDEVDEEMLKDLAKSAAKVAGKPALVALLKKYKATSVSEIPEAKYEAAAKAMRALAETEDDDATGDDDTLFD